MHKKLIESGFQVLSANSGDISFQENHKVEGDAVELSINFDVDHRAPADLHQEGPKYKDFTGDFCNKSPALLEFRGFYGFVCEGLLCAGT